MLKCIYAPGAWGFEIGMKFCFRKIKEMKRLNLSQHEIFHSVQVMSSKGKRQNLKSREDFQGQEPPSLLSFPFMTHDTHPKQLHPPPPPVGPGEAQSMLSCRIEMAGAGMQVCATADCEQASQNPGRQETQGRSSRNRKQSDFIQEPGGVAGSQENVGWSGRQLLQVLSGSQTRAGMHQRLMRMRVPGRLEDFMGPVSPPTMGRKHLDTEEMEGKCSSPDPWTRTAALEPSASLRKEMG